MNKSLTPKGQIDDQQIDATVERIVERGVLLTPKTKPLFKDHWNVDQLRQSFRGAILHLYQNPVLGNDPDLSVAVGEFLRDWNRNVLSKDSFIDYQQTMLLQGDKPLTKEQFRYSSPEPMYYKQRRHYRHYRIKPDRVLQRNCAAELWRIIGERGIVPGCMVETDVAGSSKREKRKVVKITPDCMVVLEGIDLPRFPHKLSISR